MDSILPVVAVGISTISFLVASIIFVWIQSCNKRIEEAEANIRRCGDIITDSRLHPLTTEKMAQQANYSHIANSLQVELHAVDTPNPLIPYTKISAINKVIIASKEKKGKDTKGPGSTPSAEALPVTAKTQEKTSEEKKDVFAKPENQRAKVAVNDPHYQTLANLDNADAFGNDKKSDKNTTASAPKKENKPVEKKKEKDPPEDEQKYQTLAAVEANDKKDQEEKAAAAAAAAAATAAADAKKGFQAPQVVKKAESNDPQYQTLVNLENADAFGPQKPVFKTPTKVSKAEAKDPQYQTLAGLDDNLFKEEEKAGDGKKKDKEEKKKSEKDKKDEKNKEKEKKKSDKEKGKEISKEGSKEAKKESIDNIGDDIFKKKSQRSEIKNEMKDEKAAGSKKSKRSKSKKSKREGSKKSKRAT
ncbi:hypothetical protein PRIPAC_86408 [Pristionchus pacificus]|uniref:Uncharacterized protein n=1 Tax=Pristionchus pacificus TaxID=54126 RepID=A0A2A6CIN3_PRIPA|nr:hypothetical protein PRIPAC_86408 [Pristionchus pacificus]|eukprot:PDM77999.1 hypothetical protein PRIPAC_35188 [Pristionchus pacificus]